MVRLSFLLVLGGLVALSEGQALRVLASSRGINIGCAYKNGGGPGTYNNTLAREFNGVVGENNMKWDALQAVRGTFTFAAADAMVNFAQQNNMIVRGHTFVWHQQSGFVANMPAQATVKATRDTMFKVMKTHITTVMRHFKGKIHEWDIVNEAVARDSAGMRLGTGTSSSFWSLRTDAVNHNWDFVDSAYTYARQADSTAFLVYNDYDCEGMGKKSDLVYALVSRLKAKGLVDGVGLQCHFYVPGTSTGSNGAFNPSEIVANFKRLADLGLRISLTEIDFRVPTPPTSAHLAAQRDAYETLLEICLANPSCKNFFVWGLNDGASWIPDEYPGQGAPLLFNDSFNPKPAYTGVQAVLQVPVAIRAYRNGGSLRLSRVRLHGPFDLLGRTLPALPANLPNP